MLLDASRRRRCSGTRIDGLPCRSFPLAEEDFCFSHSPRIAEAREAARRRGGLGKSIERRTAKQWVAAGQELSADDLPSYLVGVALSVADGTTSPGVGSAVAGILRVSVAISEGTVLVKRLNELEDAIRAIEQTRRSGGTR